jgi:hypothetical protein
VIDGERTPTHPERFAQVVARITRAHPVTAGVVTAAWILTECDAGWLVEMLPALEREWPKEETING